MFAIDSDKDEFDISDSDGEGLAAKISKTKKKAPAKKLAKSSDLFSDMMEASKTKQPPGPASKKLPIPKKTTEATKRGKPSESQSETDKPVKKRVKKAVVESDSDADLFDTSLPPAPRTKPGRN